MRVFAEGSCSKCILRKCYDYNYKWNSSKIIKQYLYFAAVGLREVCNLSSTSATVMQTRAVLIWQLLSLLFNNNAQR